MSAKRAAKVRGSNNESRGSTRPSRATLRAVGALGSRSAYVLLALLAGAGASCVDEDAAVDDLLREPPVVTSTDVGPPRAAVRRE